MTKMLPNSGWCLPPIVHNLHWESFLPAPELLSPTPETSRFSVLMSQLCQSSASACVSVDLTQSLFCGGKFCGCWLQCWPTLVGLFKQHMLALSSRSRQPDKSILKRNTEAWKSTETRIKIRLYSTSQTLKGGVDKNTRTTTPISISYVIAHVWLCTQFGIWWYSCSLWDTLDLLNPWNCWNCYFSYSVHITLTESSFQVILEMVETIALELVTVIRAVFSILIWTKYCYKWGKCLPILWFKFLLWQNGKPVKKPE